MLFCDIIFIGDRMKLKVKNIAIFIIIAIAICSAIYFLFINDHSVSNDKKTTKYSEKSLKRIKKLKIDDKVNKKKYSKTLDVAIFSNNFKSDKIAYYEGIDYVDNENIILYINTLADDGLAINEINEIFTDYLSYNNFDIRNAKRYVAYKHKNSNLNEQDIVTRVNLNLDKPYYTDTKIVEHQDDIYALVNKYNYVDISYVPSNMKALFNNSSIKMVSVAADAYEELVRAARAEAITLVGTTAYRAASFQKQLYDSYVARDGVEKADTYSARPGYSEHQLGYSVDLNDPNYQEKRLSFKDYEWLKNNSYKYGFIIRYPEGSEDITGYQEEDWNIRYVGKDVATKIHDLNITFDEYYDLYIAKH